MSGVIDRPRRVQSARQYCGLRVLPSALSADSAQFALPQRPNRRSTFPGVQVRKSSSVSDVGSRVPLRPPLRSADTVPLSRCWRRVTQGAGPEGDRGCSLRTSTMSRRYTGRRKGLGRQAGSLCERLCHKRRLPIAYVADSNSHLRGYADAD
jgi:hypothetical protein